MGLFFSARLGGMAAGLVWARDPVKAPEHAAGLQQENTQNIAPPCIQPPPMVRIEDYDGPLKKVSGAFARPLERKAVHPSHYKPSAKLCTFTLKDKFVLFVQDLFDPVTFLSAGIDAGIDQTENMDPSCGQGAEGYAKGSGAEYTGRTSCRFFQNFAYPTIFSKDPSYYRLAHCSPKKRLFHAVGHVAVGHRDDSRAMFNFSEWLGTASAVALSNSYHSDYRRGFSPAAKWVCYSVLQDMDYDVLREFWPEISRKFKLPFRAEPEVVSHDSNPPTQ